MTRLEQRLSVGAVAIGRNEGERLRRCLESLRAQDIPVVYVDSGSTDSSVALARSFGCEVVQLDRDSPFTAARARNAGFKRLLERGPDLDLVQFVDGDCEVARGWIPAAEAFLRSDTNFAVACGRRHERFPKKTVYNGLCDLEWNTPIGEAEACGGDALMRIDAFRQVGGFDGRLIAGEEPELCSRLRKASWRVMRLDQDMTFHDADMRRFSEWWRRSTRAGWAYLNGAAMEGRLLGGRWVRETVRPWFWCVGIPASSIALAAFLGWYALVPLLAYPVVAVRAAKVARAKGSTFPTAAAFGLFSVLGKPAELLGQLRWIGERVLGKNAELIEYKAAA